ncbi:MAG: hypothetical protein K2M05_05760 [Paramuribaculum sp.]|nr:hypothetical protein [Paramuribaculum sp.]
MEIVVSDTNIFIDLYSIGMLDALCALPYDVRTVDFVIAELTDPNQAAAISELIANEKIKVENFDSDELEDIIVEYSTVSGNLSVPDCSVCYYARKHFATLLTGDRRLRKYAEASNVTVKGVLFVFDELVACKVISAEYAAMKLRELLGINVRLPRSEIEKRIDRWTEK